MSNMAPGEGSPNDNPAAVPEQPYEPHQGTGDAERPQEEVEEAQQAPPSPVQGAVGRTDVYGRPIQGEPQPDPEPERDTQGTSSTDAPADGGQ